MSSAVEKLLCFDKIVLIIVFSGFCNVGLCYGVPVTNRNASTTFGLFKNCFDDAKTMEPVLNCIKDESLFRIKRALNFDVLTLYDGVKLVKNSNHTSNSTTFSESRKSRNQGWLARVMDQVSDSLEDHVLQVDLKNLVETARGRHRHRANKMMPIMMFGVTLMGMVLVPMGFQFLAVLGGKALLLSKMALLLSSLQGLKKVASSSYAHGLYEGAPAPAPYYDWSPYDRAEYHQAAGYEAQKRIYK